MVVVIFGQKIYDNIYRAFKGMPTLKRSQITADLFLGSQYSLIGLRKMKALGITAIINMREHSIYSEAQYEGFSYLHLPTVDNTPPTLEILIKGAEFADQEIKSGGKVYIHCRQGLGRGPTMTIAYLLKTGLTYEDAFALVRKVRTFINPRPSQIGRLNELEQYYKTLSEAQIK
ncbi:Dual specificity phosphatase, catalytic domain [Pedobacter westerhofensis]|uniref:Dual specificity phosphatase, catalytic domain n=2 Tax=Pedobacter westerhofensis TaxID=425512 RepID=A0A521AFR2_9SPHI|nr:Dual specificity phosphatase, catalytic domain [Pedobacter westerhofensis]